MTAREKISVYAVIAVANNLQSCGNGYNSDAKKPENVRVDIIRSNTPQPQPQQQIQTGPSQSQSQSSNNENNNNVYVCPPEARCYFN